MVIPSLEDEQQKVPKKRLPVCNCAKVRTENCFLYGSLILNSVIIVGFMVYSIYNNSQTVQDLTSLKQDVKNLNNDVNKLKPKIENIIDAITHDEDTINQHGDDIDNIIDTINQYGNAIYQNFDIAEISTLTATSYFNDNWQPGNALFKREHAWHPAEGKYENQQVVAHFSKECLISGVTTRGRGREYNQYITKYKLEYLDKNNNWQFIGIYDGNTDMYSLKKNIFDKPVSGYGLRLSALSYSERPVLKLAIHGYCG